MVLPPCLVRRTNEIMKGKKLSSLLVGFLVRHLMGFGRCSLEEDGEGAIPKDCMRKTTAGYLIFFLLHHDIKSKQMAK